MSVAQHFLIVSLVVYLGAGVSSTASYCPDCDDVDVTCVDGVCLPRCVNVTSSGECLQCRDLRFYGKQCENDCSYTCLNSTCQLMRTRVVCTEGCVAGRKGNDCGVDCPTSCTQCERHGDRCIGQCSSSMYYGDRCDKPCLSNCRGGCDRDTGECDKCMSGYTGRYCNDTCSPLCSKGCDKDTGACVSCGPGRWGRYCNEICPSYCSGGCDQASGNCNSCSSRGCSMCDEVTGHCRQCAPGHCRTRCDEPCLPCKGKQCRNPTCLMVCPENCNNYNLPKEECIGSCINNNFHGKNCNIRCPQNCDGCDKDTASCLKCAVGLMGENCTTACPSNCTSCERYDNICIGPCPDRNRFGKDCSLDCSVGCSGCYKDTGVCVECAKRFSRTYCDEVCSPCTGQDCGNKTCQFREGFKIWPIITAAIVLIIIIAVLLTIRSIYIHERPRSPSPCGTSVNTTSTYHSYCDVEPMSSVTNRRAGHIPPGLSALEEEDGLNYEAEYEDPYSLSQSTQDCHGFWTEGVVDGERQDISSVSEMRQMNQLQMAPHARCEIQAADNSHSQTSSYAEHDFTGDSRRLDIRPYSDNVSSKYLTPFN